MMKCLLILSIIAIGYAQGKGNQLVLFFHRLCLCPSELMMNIPLPVVSDAGSASNIALRVMDSLGAK